MPPPVMTTTGIAGGKRNQHSISCCDTALATVCVVVRQFSFSRAALRWNRTVLSLIPRMMLASHAVLPAATHFRQYSSRAETSIWLSVSLP
jgi:hypothetical protein